VSHISRIAAAVVLSAAAVLPSAGLAAAEPAPTPPEPILPGPPVVDQDGTYVVGTDIIAGVYASGGPVDGGTCYWRRIGADDATLGNALTKQPQLVVIEATDVAFKTNGCQPWQPTDAAPPAQTPPWLSQLQLQHNLNILNGLAGQSGNGQLPAY
jgi:hypothetical protein